MKLRMPWMVLQRDALFATERSLPECKTTTNRIKGQGRRWDRENAEAMMALAALDDSKMWQQYWPTPKPERN